MKVHRRHRRAGFSLTEMLVVVGLIAILLGVGVPSILYYQRELKLTELDDNARAVFVAAQNHLTALRSASAGELEVSAAAGREAKSLAAGETPAETELRYVSTDVAGAKPGWLVLPGSIESDLAEGSYLVEFEPKSGTVYGVFFMERGGKVLDDGTYTAVRGADCRTRAGRKSFCQSSGGFYVGYYGAAGKLDVDRPDAQELPTPKLELINAEELRVNISTEGWPTGIDADKVYASVSVSDGAASKTLVREGAIRSGVESAVVLDTLKPSSYNTNDVQPTAGWSVGNSFAQWMAEGSDYRITPGADITVTVSVFYQPGAGEGVVALPQSASVSANSLFASRSGETVDVRYGRHLQNLDKDTSCLDSAITAARQIREIDFAKTGGGVYSWVDTYGHDARPFTPINNAQLQRYDGNDLIVRSLKVENPSGNAGLFAAFHGSRLEKVTLVDAQVNGATAGALAGEISNTAPTTLSACRVYTTKRVATPPQVWGSTYAGGLIGHASNCTIQDGSFAATTVYGSNVGGLVGRSEGSVAISNSYAAGHLTGGANVGGLVGAGGGVRIEDSYAAGTIAKATNKAGGLSTDSATVRRSYAAVEYVEAPAPESVYGLVPSGSCANAYYLVKLGINDKVTPSGVTAVTSTGKMRKDQGLALGSAFGEGGDASIKAVPYNLPNQTDGTREPKLAAPYPYPTLNLGVAPNKTAVPHYGDWLEGDALRGVVSYYEQYETSSGLKTDYFYYALNGDGVLETKGSLNATGSLFSDGYAFLSLNKLHEDDKSTVPMLVAIGADAEMKEYTTLYLGTYEDGPVTYYAYGLPNSVLDGAVAAADYFLQLRVAGLDSSAELNSLWLNPHFGKTAYNGYGDTNPSKASGAAKVPVPDGTGDVIPIRSVRQFNNMRKYPSDIKSWTQELDMDAAVYRGHQLVDAEGYLTLGGLRVTARQADGTWAPVKGSALPTPYRLAMPPIAMNNGTDTFGGAYHGGGKVIRNLSIGSRAEGSEQYAGLFYKLAGSAALEEIHLADSDVTGVSGAEKNFTGALTANTEGTVTNCTVENISVRAPQAGSGTGGFVGGLVGYVRKGAVDGCQAVNCAVDGGAAAYVGGFAGGFSEGSIQSSGVRVEGTDPDALYKAKTVTGQDRSGGFAGIVGDGNRAGQVRFCYAAVQVTGKTAGGFAGELKNGTAADCYAGGHTKEGKYTVDLPNVTGSASAGGFAGTWGGGSLSGLCYTTCAVSGADADKTDVFAVGAKTAPTGCYAGGDVYVNGTKVKAGEHNSAKVTTGTLPAAAEATRAVAHPYDSSLPMVYPYKPVTNAAGAAMAHYGDWPRKVPTTSSKYEWMPKPETFDKPKMDNLSAKAEWNGNTLEIEFEAFGWSKLTDWFATSGGYMAITTDLGYVLPMKVESGFDYSTYPSVPFAKLIDENGTVWTAEVQTKDGDESTGWQPTRTYKFTVSSEVLPPYLETINVGEFKFAPMITDIKNSDPDGCTNKPTEEFPPRGKTIEIDGKYADWTGYPSQLLAYTPGNSSITGISYGSAFGRHSTIFVHARNAYTRVEMPFEGKKLQDMPMFKNLPTSVRGDDNWFEHLSGWHEHFSNLDYTGPGIYEWKELRPDPETGEMVPTVLVQAYVDVQEDGTQEVEMAFYLDRIAGADVADKIDHFQISFDFGGSLTVERNLDEKDAWADD